MTTERETAVAELRELLPPGTTVQTILRHVSRSGMTRRISPVLMREGERPYHLDYLVSIVLGRKTPAHGGEGVKIEGCGMDMGFELIYQVSSALYPDGFECVGDGREPCPTCGGSGQRATAKSANGSELERHERAGTPCDDCGGDGWTGRYLPIRCHSNDHSNGDRNYEPHHHRSGGYALRQEWL